MLPAGVHRHGRFHATAAQRLSPRGRGCAGRSVDECCCGRSCGTAAGGVAAHMVAGMGRADSGGPSPRAKPRVGRGARRLPGRGRAGRLWVNVAAVVVARTAVRNVAAHEAMGARGGVVRGRRRGRGHATALEVVATLDVARRPWGSDAAFVAAATTVGNVAAHEATGAGKGDSGDRPAVWRPAVSRPASCARRWSSVTGGGRDSAGRDSAGRPADGHPADGRPVASRPGVSSSASYTPLQQPLPSRWV